jgi:hypothetical protein
MINRKYHNFEKDQLEFYKNILLWWPSPDPEPDPDPDPGAEAALR